MMLHTPLTELLGIETPIVSAAMAGCSGSALASQVSLAGGFGFISPTPSPSATEFTHELEAARRALGVPPGGVLPIGAGFLGWVLDKGGAPVACLDAALAQRVKAVWLSMGADLGKWVQHVRAHDAARAAPHTTLVWVLVNSVADAVRAAEEWRADVLVVQGIEAGGHGHGAAPPLLTLLPMIQRALPNAPPLLAAGGLVTGAHVAAALMLGAAGAVLGTRFVATPEATHPPLNKAQLLAASDTVRTMAYDEVRETVGWPPGIDGRALRNKVYDDQLEGLSLEERLRRYKETMKSGDLSRTVVWAGTSVGLVTEMSSACDVVKSIHAELIAQLNRAATILG